MDTEDKLNMSLDDLSARRTSTALGARRASRRPAPYGGRGGGAPFAGVGMRGYPSMGGRPEVCNNCKMPGHIARECTNLAVCNNCGAPGHLAASCSSEVVCRNCKQTGHIASECTNEPVCHVCKKPGHLAFGCAAANLSAPIPKSQLCNNCFKPGHIASECKNEVACNNCRQTGHKARDCTNPPVCNNCGQTGHMARSCTAQLAGPACHSCGMVGHLARNCPHGATMMRALQPMMGIPPVAAATAFPMAQLVAPTMAVDPNVICRNCRQPGHYARDCGQPVLCNNCGGRGHFAADCPSDSRTLRGSRR